MIEGAKGKREEEASRADKFRTATSPSEQFSNLPSSYSVTRIIPVRRMDIGKNRTCISPRNLTQRTGHLVVASVHVREAEKASQRITRLCVCYFRNSDGPNLFSTGVRVRVCVRAKLFCDSMGQGLVLRCES